MREVSIEACDGVRGAVSDSYNDILAGHSLGSAAPGSWFVSSVIVSFGRGRGSVLQQTDLVILVLMSWSAIQSPFICFTQDVEIKFCFFFLRLGTADST
jgi:hypothetical protein